MDKVEPCFLTASELSGLLKRREISPVEATQSCLKRIEEIEPVINSFITVLADQALIDARAAEAEIMSGHYRGGLHGVPFAVKDLFCTRGIRTTSGTRIFHDFIPKADATVVAKLKDAGAVLLGKLNLQHLALGPAGENPDYGDMKNPWNLEYIAGGSSGGSATAVAANEAPFTLGTDTGGSVRLPASMCNVVGLKPTYGLVSRHGITATSWSLDTPGPLTRTVEDCALVMNTIAGFDSLDPASADIRREDYMTALGRGVDGLRIGVPKEFFQVPYAPEVRDQVTTALSLFEQMGAVVTEVSWPMFPLAQAISTTILLAEAAAEFGDLVREHGADLTDPVVRLRIESGFLVPAFEYLKAQRARSLFRSESHDVFKNVDLLAGPTLPLTASLRGVMEVQVGEATMHVLNAFTQYCRPFNTNGFPAITIPCGFSEQSLPVGLQLAARPFDEASILRSAFSYQQSTTWHQRRPPL